MKVFVKGLHGCGMRVANVQQYVDFLKANDHEVVDHPKESDVMLLWTCAFRGDFRDNSLREVKRYMADYDAELVVVGCLPDIDNATLTEEFPGRFINWKDDEAQLEAYFGAPKKKLSEIPRKLGAPPLTDDVEKFKKDNPDQDAAFSDQFIKLFISEGCKYKCTYCSEILAFPPYHSFTEEELAEECRKQIKATGRHEIMLLGDSIGDYGTDIGSTLPRLIRRLCDIDPTVQIALLGYNPAGFIRYFDEMAGFIKSGRIRHMQLPVQSASVKLLKLMNRPYTRDEIDRIFSFLNDVGFTEFETHIIVGFPGETDDDMEETIRFILRHKPKYVLASKYMETDRMPSQKLPCKVDYGTQTRRISDATRRIKEAGILCNSDDSHLSEARFRTLNKIRAKGERDNGHDKRRCA